MLLNVQALRALAALMVIYVHCEVLMAPMGKIAPFLTDYRDSFASGVDLFFVISGFIMVHTTMNNPPSAEFLAKRVIRIVPLYWTLTLLVFSVATVAPTALAQTKASVQDLVQSLLFVPYTRSDGTIRPVLFVGWSLNFEMLFYVLFGAALLVKNARLRITIVAVALVALTALGQVWSSSTNPPMQFFTRPFFLEFIPGMLVGLLFNTMPSLSAPKTLSLAGLALSLVAIPALSHINQTPWPLQCIPAATALLFALLLEKQGFTASNRKLQQIGAASYSLYLFHPFVTQAVTKVALAAGAITAVESPALLVVAYLIAIFAAIVIFNFIEEPATRLLNGLIRRSRHESPVTSAFKHPESVRVEPQ